MWYKMVKKAFFLISAWLQQCLADRGASGRLAALEEGLGSVLRAGPNATVKEWEVACCPAPRVAAARKNKMLLSAAEKKVSCSW